MIKSVLKKVFFSFRLARNVGGDKTKDVIKINTECHHFSLYSGPLQKCSGANSETFEEKKQKRL